jgi:hypothetical protein
MNIKDFDTLVMLSILRLHGGKSIKLVNGKLTNVPGINDIYLENVFSFIVKNHLLTITIEDITKSINRFISYKLVTIENNRLCPSYSLIRYYIEILKDTDCLEEQLKILDAKMNRLIESNRSDW